MLTIVRVVFSTVLDGEFDPVGAENSSAVWDLAVGGSSVVEGVAMGFLGRVRSAFAGLSVVGARWFRLRGGTR